MHGHGPASPTTESRSRSPRPHGHRPESATTEPCSILEDFDVTMVTEQGSILYNEGTSVDLTPFASEDILSEWGHTLPTPTHDGTPWSQAQTETSPWPEPHEPLVAANAGRFVTCQHGGVVYGQLGAVIPGEPMVPWWEHPVPEGYYEYTPAEVADDPQWEDSYRAELRINLWMVSIGLMHPWDSGLWMQVETPPAPQPEAPAAFAHIPPPPPPPARRSQRLPTPPPPPRRA